MICLSAKSINRIPGFIDAGKKYADGNDVNLYLLSPINGEFKSNCVTLFFYGIDKLLNADFKKFQEKVKGSIANFKFYEY